MKTQYISTTELAKLLNISRIAVYKKIRSGQIEAEKIGRNYAVNVEDLGGIFGSTLSSAQETQIDQAVQNAVQDYGGTIKLLGQS